MYVKSSESFQFLKYNMFYYKKLFWSILTLPLKLSYFEYLDVIFIKNATLSLVTLNILM